MAGEESGDSNGTNAWYTPSIHTLSSAHPGGCTDPFMWMDPRGRYHALFHCHWVTGDQVCVSWLALSPAVSTAALYSSALTDAHCSAARMCMSM